MGEILFSMVPEAVEKVETGYRCIVTPIPVPESLPLIETLQQYEPLSMCGQPWWFGTGPRVLMYMTLSETSGSI